ncbi:hypothetical protein [Mycobacterium sp.]|jgi:hypothetical protein|uniref:hypothetical protein n=1 Tax=Mycobacterium sp. TaxID=1785 RepID=UPI003F9595F4
MCDPDTQASFDRDLTQDGADVGFAVLDRLKAEMLHRVGLPELLTTATQDKGLSA